MADEKDSSKNIQPDSGSASAVPVKLNKAERKKRRRSRSRKRNTDLVPLTELTTDVLTTAFENLQVDDREDRVEQPNVCKKSTTAGNECQQRPSTELLPSGSNEMVYSRQSPTPGSKQSTGDITHNRKTEENVLLGEAASEILIKLSDQEEDSKSVYCPLCDVYVVDIALNLAEHCKGRKHKANIEKQKKDLDQRKISPSSSDKSGENKMVAARSPAGRCDGTEDQESVSVASSDDLEKVYSRNETGKEMFEMKDLRPSDTCEMSAQMKLNPKKVYCSYCHVYLTGPALMDQHQRGSRHRDNVEQQKQKTDRQTLVLLPGQSNENDAARSRVKLENEISEKKETRRLTDENLFSIFEQKKGSKRVYCPLCSVYLENSPGTMAVHCRGTKHKANLQMQESCQKEISLPNEKKSAGSLVNLSKVDADQNSYAEHHPVNRTEDIERTKSDKDLFEKQDVTRSDRQKYGMIFRSTDSDSKQVYCPICQMLLMNNSSVMAEHCGGRRHKANVEQQNQELKTSSKSSSTDQLSSKDTKPGKETSIDKKSNESMEKLVTEQLER